MINTLTLTPSTSYPLFSPNQVLSDRDLNHMVTYLERQNRLSRNHFMGMGIACGLIPNAIFQPNPGSPTATIRLSPGSGMTSEGYVVALPETVTLTHYQDPQEIAATRFQVSDDSQSSESLTPSSLVTGGNASGTTDDVAEAPVLYTVTELFTGAEEDRNRKPLGEIIEQATEGTFQALLDQHILIVLYDLEETSRDTCLLDCDDLGRDRNFKLRYFLVPKTTGDTETHRLSAEALLQNGYAPESLPAPWTNTRVKDIFQQRQSFLQRHRIQVPRFGYDDVTFSTTLTRNASPSTSADASAATNAEPSTESDGESDANTTAGGPLFGVEDFETFLGRYGTLCEQTITKISQVLPPVVEIFSPFFSSIQPQPNDLSSVGDRLTTHLQSILATTPFEAQYTIQYFSDYLAQVAAAYDELVHAAFDLMDDCLPDIRRFPKFLMLGQIPVTAASDGSADASLPFSNLPLSDLRDPYRNHFVQPPLYNQNHQRRRQVRYLYDRLVRLCDAESFAPLPFYAAPVHITPSRDRSNPLSAQALPYYLHYASLYQIWNYEADRKGLSAHQPAYFLPQANPNNPAETPTTRDDLRYRLDAYDFYRIEGHLGKDKATMLTQLREYRQRWGLTFDIVTLKIGTTIDPDDGDTVDDLNQSGRLEAINQDFEGMTSLFQSLWAINPDWSENTFLATLKRDFFDQPTFSDISPSQLFNPMLAAVRADTDGQVYHFDEVENNGQPTGRYRLEIVNANQEPFAQVMYERENGERVDALDWSNLTSEVQEQEQTRLRELISKTLVADRMAYGVETPDNPNGAPSQPPSEFILTLTLGDTVGLPIDAPGNQPRSVKVVIIFQNAFTVQTTDSGPLVQQTAFKNYETLYGLLRDVPENYADSNDLSFQMGDRVAALDYIRAFHLPERIEAYQIYSGQVTTPRLLDQFAKAHPGLEHLGGVPQGGTFVLAYADDPTLAASLLTIRSSPAYAQRVDKIQKKAVLPSDNPEELAQVEADFRQWTNIVVADYCLPYRVAHQTIHASGSGSTLDVPPIVLLEKTTFCADDDELYEFRLHPPNGQLKGEGSFFANGTYYFQPTRVSPDLQHDVAIAFTYAVDGYENSLVILVSPEPDTRFLIGKSDRTEFCVIDRDVALIPCFGRGTFTARDGATNITARVIQDDRLFRPSQVDLGGADSKTITLRHRISNDQGTCTGETNRDITIHAQPLVNFSFGENNRNPEENPVRVCANVAELDLRGTPANGVFRVLDGNQDISVRMLRGDRLLPSVFNLEGATNKTIQVEYSVTDADGCTNDITKPLTIVALPNADFRVGNDNRTILSQQSDPVRLLPDTSGGEFEATIEGINVSDQVLETQGTNTQFIPENVIVAQDQVQVLVIYSVRNSDGCQQRSRQRITVVAPPDARFEVGDSGQTVFFEDDSPVPLIPERLGGTFSAFDGDDEITSEVIRQQRRRFIPDQVDLGRASQKRIRLRHEIARRGFTNAEEQIVTVRKRPEESEEDGGDRNSPSPGNSPAPGDSPSPSPSDDPRFEIAERPEPIAVPLGEEAEPANPIAANPIAANPIAANPIAVDLIETEPITAKPSANIGASPQAIARFSTTEQPFAVSVLLSQPHAETFNSDPERPSHTGGLRQFLQRSFPSRTKGSFIASSQPLVSLDHSPRREADRLKPKLLWTAAVGAIATVIVLVWAGTESNRSQSPTSINPAPSIDRVS